MEKQSLYQKTSKEPVKLETLKGPLHESNREPLGNAEKK
jgi:hypothetical protein